MTKAELLADIDAKVLKTVKVFEEPDSDKNAAGVKMYIANVMEQKGDTITGRNIGFYTINEGQAGEEAYYRDQVNPKNVAQAAVEAYLAGQALVRVVNMQVNEEKRFAVCEVVVDNGNSTASKETWFVYKDGANPVTHLKMV